MRQAVLQSPKPSSKDTSVVNFNGRWTNVLGSTMVLTVASNGTVSGKYKTAVGSPTANEEFNALGFVSGDLITFSANFGRYGSLTSWAGKLEGMLVNESAFLDMTPGSMSGALGQHNWREQIAKAKKYLVDQAVHEKGIASGKREQPPRKPVSDEVFG